MYRPLDSAMTASRREKAEKLKAQGFTIGPRTDGIDAMFKGKFVIANPEQGVVAAIGDDLAQMIDHAHRIFIGD